jgi:hypothetical protein
MNVTSSAFLRHVSIILHDNLLFIGILGAFAKLRKATIGFVMSICPSVRFHLTDFGETWYLSFFFFRKSVDKSQVLFKSDKNNRYFTWTPFDIFDDISLNSFRMGNILDDSCRENQNTRFVFNNFFPKISKNVVES